MTTFSAEHPSGWQFIGTTEGGGVLYVRHSHSSRIHELSRLSFTALVATYHEIVERKRKPGQVGMLHGIDRQFTDRDRVITAIRELEDPHRLAMHPMLKLEQP